MKNGQRGFTLIELLISVAIIAVILPALSMTIMTFITNYQRAADRDIIQSQVQNAGYWISRDIRMATMVSLTAPNGFPVTIEISVDTNPSNDYSIDYLLDQSKLKRQVFDSVHTLISESIIADYIDATDTALTPTGGNTYQLVVEAEKGEAVSQANYIIRPRPQ